MPTTTTKSNTRRIPLPIQLEELAESIWRLSRQERESLEDILEEKFVKTVLRRSKEIPRLRKEKKLISLKDLRREFR